MRKPIDCRITATLLVVLMVTVTASSCGSPPTPAPPPDRAAYDAGVLQYPGATWVEAERPAEWGWSQPRLEEARAYFDELDAAALMVVHRGVLVASWGDVAVRYNGQSMRKALLGAMIGQEVEAGRLELEATLEELGIDDASQPLTPEEKQASVLDLLQSRTGIYLSALYETGGWKRNKPERGSHRPGESWYYNNWGFNALGTLFEKVSGASIEEAFAERIALPIGMEDYRPKDVHYLTRRSVTERSQGNDSEHDAYVFMISARDMARFGLLYLGGGRWQDETVVPESWVQRSVEESVSTLEFLEGDRYGYLWWVSPAESALGRAVGQPSYKSTGGRGHKTLVVPRLELVVVLRLATGGVGLTSQLRRRLLGAPAVDDAEFNELVRRIVAAHPDRAPG